MLARQDVGFADGTDCAVVSRVKRGEERLSQGGPGCRVAMDGIDRQAEMTRLTQNDVLDEVVDMFDPGLQL